MKTLNDVDFDSMSTSSMTTQIVGPNGNETTISETKSSTTEGKTQPEKEVEVTKIEPVKIEDPDKIYEDSNHESATFGSLNTDWNHELSSANNQAEKSSDLENLIRGDQSYQEGDTYSYKGSLYDIVDYDDPANLKITPERAEQLEDEEAQSAFDRYLRDWN